MASPSPAAPSPIPLDGSPKGTLVRPLSDTHEGCKLSADALRSLNLKKVHKEIRVRQKKAAWTTATSLSFLVVWVVLMVVRYRVLRRRPSRLVCDVICALLAAAATVLFVVGATALSSPPQFWNETRQYLVDNKDNSITPNAESFIDQLPCYFLDKCYFKYKCRSNPEYRKAAGIHKPRLLNDIRERAQLLDDALRDIRKRSVMYIVASSLAAIAVLFVLASIISFILAACVKTVPEDGPTSRGPNSPIYNTATDIRGRSIRSPVLNIGNNNNSNGSRGRWRGAAALGRLANNNGGTIRQDGTINDMPATEAIEFFSRFIQKVPPPQDGVVLGHRGGDNGTDCRICLEVLLEDVGRLTACNHDFHRRCILQWLLRSDDPSCPLCKEPVRLCSTPYSHTPTTPSTSQHSHTNDGNDAHHRSFGQQNNNTDDVHIQLGSDTELDHPLAHVAPHSRDSSIIPPPPSAENNRPLYASYR